MKGSSDSRRWRRATGGDSGSIERTRWGRINIQEEQAETEEQEDQREKEEQREQ